MNLRKLLLASLLTIGANFAYGQYISTSYFGPHSVANDGTVVGYKEWGGPYMLWHADTNEEEEIGGVAPGNNFGGLAVFSDDSNFISGTAFNNEQTPLAEPAYYNRTTKTWTTLGNFGGFSGSAAGGAFSISGNGKTVTGNSYATGNNKAFGFAWSEKDGLTQLKTQLVNVNARGEDISKDGSTIVGWQENEIGQWEAAVWHKNPYGKGYFMSLRLTIDPQKSTEDISNRLGWAKTISGDGKWIGGNGNGYYPNAWIWNQEGGLVKMGTLTNDPGTTGYVTTMTYDGSVVYGYYITKQSISDNPVYRPFIYTKEGGMKDLNEYVKNVLKFDTKGDKIYVPTKLSSDGKYLLGWGFNTDTYEKVTFRIQLKDNLSTDEIQSSPKATLYPNPVTNVLNIDAKQQISSVSIYTLTGQQIFTKSFQTKSSTIDMSAYKAGVYIVEVNSNGKTQTYKVIKK